MWSAMNCVFPGQLPCGRCIKSMGQMSSWAAGGLRHGGFIKYGYPKPLVFLLGYGSIPINTIFRGMNIHLPAILMFTRGTRFWHTVIDDSQFWMILGYPYFRKPPYIYGWQEASIHFHDAVPESTCHDVLRGIKNRNSSVWAVLAELSNCCLLIAF